MKRSPAILLAASFLLAACDNQQQGAEVSLQPQPNEILISKYHVAVGKNVFASQWERGDGESLIVKTPTNSGVETHNAPCSTELLSTLEMAYTSLDERRPHIVANLKGLTGIGGIEAYSFSDAEGPFDHAEGLTRASNVVAALHAQDIGEEIAARKAFCSPYVR